MVWCHCGWLGLLVAALLLDLGWVVERGLVGGAEHKEWVVVVMVLSQWL
jgi:hypothetical protein